MRRAVLVSQRAKASVSEEEEALPAEETWPERHAFAIFIVFVLVIFMAAKVFSKSEKKPHVAPAYKGQCNSCGEGIKMYPAKKSCVIM